ncbi:DUF1015 family protein [Fibrobacterota bacterium]
MAQIKGLQGLRPPADKAALISSPPYDVIKPGSPLEAALKANPCSLYHLILGGDPPAALEKFIREGLLQEDTEACYYLYRQNWKDEERMGIFAAVAVDDYAKHNIIRHEKTFDDKVQGRIQLARETGLTMGPIFFLTRSLIQSVMENIKGRLEPVYEFVSDLGGHSDMHGIHNRIYRVPEDSQEGNVLQQEVAKNPLYIADGHHRYHAALRNGQTHTLAYITQNATIQAYNRVINGKTKFSSVKDQLKLEPRQDFQTPEKHHFCIYTGEGCYTLAASHVPEDVVGKLDCSILEKELYPSLGISHDMVLNQDYFDYYPESELETMKQVVDEGRFDLAVALHPVSPYELMEVANAGLADPEIVMPEKSTFFSPKILSGLFLYRHQLRE